MKAPRLPSALLLGQCPYCGRRVWFRRLRRADVQWFPVHRNPDKSGLCARLPTVKTAVYTAMDSLGAEVQAYRELVGIRREVMGNPLRGELPGDVEELCVWESKIAVLDHQVARLTRVARKL